MWGSRDKFWQSSRANPVEAFFRAASLDDIPTTPHAADEEFNGSLSAWTRAAGATFDDVNAIDPYASFTNTGTRQSLNSLRRSWLMWQPETATFPYIYKPYVPAATSLIWARFGFAFRADAATNNDSGVGLMLTNDPTTSTTLSANRVGILFNESDLNTVQVEAASTVASVNTGAVLPNVIANNWQSLQYGAILKVGTQYDFWVGNDAGSWIHVLRATNAVSFTHMAFFCTNGSTSTPGNMLVGCDFIRVRDAKVLP